MSAEDFINLAGGIIAVTGFASVALSWLFCTRPAPRWMRNWLALSWALVGVRLLTRAPVPVDPTAYGVSLVYLNVALVGTIIAWWNFYAALGPWQDRCPCETDICKTDKTTQRRIGVGMID